MAGKAARTLEYLKELIATRERMTYLGFSEADIASEVGFTAFLQHESLADPCGLDPCACWDGTTRGARA